MKIDNSFVSKNQLKCSVLIRRADLPTLLQSNIAPEPNTATRMFNYIGTAIDVFYYVRFDRHLLMMYFYDLLPPPRRRIALVPTNNKEKHKQQQHLRDAWAYLVSTWEE